MSAWTPRMIRAVLALSQIGRPLLPVAPLRPSGLDSQQHKLAHLIRLDIIVSRLAHLQGRGGQRHEPRSQGQQAEASTSLHRKLPLLSMRQRCHASLASVVGDPTKIASKSRNAASVAQPCVPRPHSLETRHLPGLETGLAGHVASEVPVDGSEGVQRGDGRRPGRNCAAAVRRASPQGPPALKPINCRSLSARGWQVSDIIGPHKSEASAESERQGRDPPL